MITNAETHAAADLLREYANEDYQRANHDRSISDGGRAVLIERAEEALTLALKIDEVVLS